MRPAVMPACHSALGTGSGPVRRPAAYLRERVTPVTHSIEAITRMGAIAVRLLQARPDGQVIDVACRVQNRHDMTVDINIRRSWGRCGDRSCWVPVATGRMWETSDFSTATATAAVAVLKSES